MSCSVADEERVAGCGESDLDSDESIEEVAMENQTRRKDRGEEDDDDGCDVYSQYTMVADLKGNSAKRNEMGRVGGKSDC